MYGRELTSPYRVVRLGSEASPESTPRAVCLWVLVAKPCRKRPTVTTSRQAASLERLVEDPILGISFANTAAETDGARGPHNSYVYPLLNTGIIAGSLYLGTLVYALGQGIRTRWTPWIGFVVGLAVAIFLSMGSSRAFGAGSAPPRSGWGCVSGCCCTPLRRTGRSPIPVRSSSSDNLFEPIATSVVTAGAVDTEYHRPSFPAPSSTDSTPTRGDPPRIDARAALFVTAGSSKPDSLESENGG